MPASRKYSTVYSITENTDIYKIRYLKKTSTPIKPQAVKYIIIILRNISDRRSRRERSNRGSEFLHAEDEGYGYPWRWSLNCFLGDEQKLPMSSDSDIHAFLINGVPDILCGKKKENKNLWWLYFTSKTGPQPDCQTQTYSSLLSFCSSLLTVSIYPQ